MVRLTAFAARNESALRPRLGAAPPRTLALAAATSSATAARAAERTLPVGRAAPDDDATVMTVTLTPPTGTSTTPTSLCSAGSTSWPWPCSGTSWAKMRRMLCNVVVTICVLTSRPLCVAPGDAVAGTEAPGPDGRAVQGTVLELPPRRMLTLTARL